MMACGKIMLATILPSLALYLSLTLALNPDEFHYPEGNLMCKPHGYGKYWDCSYRQLQSIPRYVLNKNDMTQLFIDNNKLVHITRSPFKNLSNLLVLDLAFNQISHVTSSAFSGLHRLDELLLANNQLRILPEGVFDDLINLRHLDLSFNWMTRIPSHDLIPLISLETLRLQANNLTSFTLGKGFQNLKNLSYLLLGEKAPNGKHFADFDVTGETFRYLNGAEQLKLELIWFPTNLSSLGKLSTVKDLDIIRQPQDDYESLDCPLEILSIARFEAYGSESPFEFLKKWSESLTSFALRRSQITVIQDFMFAWVPLLRKLDLSYNDDLQSISDDAFYGLDYLEELILSHNDLQEVPSNALELFKGYKTLRTLDLSYNRIHGSIPAEAFASVPFLTHLNLAGNHQINFVEDWTSVLVNLTVLNLEDTYVSVIHANLIPSLKSIYLGTPQISEIELLVKLPLCQMSSLLEEALLPNYSLIQPLADVIGNECLFLKKLDISGCFKNVRDYRLDGVDAVQNVVDLPNLEVLNLARNKIQSVIEIQFINAPKLVDLDLSYNDIQTIDDTVLSTMANVRYLKLDNNKLVSLNPLQNLIFLQTLTAAQNQITTIPPTLLRRQATQYALSILDIGGNPFDCTCEMIELQNWIKEDNITWFVPYKTHTCASPQDKKGLSITEVELNCNSQLAGYLSIGAASLLLVSITMVVILRYRWHIKYKCFLVCKRRYRRYQSYINDAEAGLDARRYDAYIVYDEDCEEDERWVVNVLRPNLEEGPQPFRLCIKGRDFIPGASILDAITESIQQSNKTILILTPRFVESEWCYFEMQMAWMRLFNENRDVIILVMLTEIPDNMLTLSLWKLLCKQEYFKWPADAAGQDLFWERLTEEIKKPVHVDRLYDM